MDAESIKRAREVIAKLPKQHLGYGTDGIKTYNFIEAAKTGWPEALDEVERLQKVHAAECLDYAADYQKLRAENERLNLIIGDSTGYGISQRIRDDARKLRTENERLQKQITNRDAEQDLETAAGYTPGSEIAKLRAVAEAAEKCIKESGEHRWPELEAAFKAWRGEK